MLPPERVLAHVQGLEAELYQKRLLKASHQESHAAIRSMRPFTCPRAPETGETVLVLDLSVPEMRLHEPN